MNGEDRRGMGVAEVEFTNKMTSITVYAKSVFYGMNGEERRGLGAEVELTNKMSPIYRMPKTYSKELNILRLR